MTIRLLDFETSSLSPDDGSVIEVGIADLILPSREVQAPKSWLCGTAYTLTPENRAVHHIMPTQLIGRDTFDPDALNDQAEEDGVTCWAAHNSSFELSWFTPRLPMICTYRSALRAWPDAPGHSLSVLRYWLDDAGRMAGFNHAHASVHRAGPDAYVSGWLLRALLEDDHTGKTLLQWSKEPPLFSRIPLGKFKGQPWSAADIGWLNWCERSDLSEDIKWNARRELSSR